MSTETMQVKMFGGFSARLGEKEFVKKAARLNKPQEFLALLLQKRGHSVTNEELMDCLWEEGEIANPAGALKNTAYTLRRQLQRKSPGVEFILTEGSSYRWNPEVPVDVDLWDFEETAFAVLSGGSLTEKEQLELCRRAIGLFSGDFLPSLSNRQWVIQRFSFLRKQCLSLICRASELLLKIGNPPELQEAYSLCSRAVMLDPLCGDLYRLLFRTLEALGWKSVILSYYPVVSGLYLDSLCDTIPSEVREIYLRAAVDAGRAQDDINQIRRDLDETTRCQRPVAGAFCCSYETFKQMYQMVARTASRDQASVALLLLTLVGKDGCTIPRSELSQTMYLLKSSVQSALRKGDVFSCYSRNQYVLMLSVRKPEDCSVVELRLRDAFQKQSPPLNVSLSIISSMPDPLI